MSSVFISHSEEDQDWATRLLAWLEDLNHHSVFLYLHEYYGIRGGTNWEQKVYTELRHSGAFIAVLSRDWAKSKWCFAEKAQARALGKYIIPLLLDDSDVDSEFPDTQIIKVRGMALHEAKKRFELALKEAPLSVSFSWNHNRPPYPGFHAFCEADAGVFFGREEEAEECIDTLRRLDRFSRDAARMLLILGPSGSGKSSLMRAGVIPRLRRSTGEWVIIDPFIPRGDAMEELAKALAQGLGADWKIIRDEIVQASASEVPDPTALFERVSDLQMKAGHNESRVLIPLDQTEEIFAYETGESPFLRLLRSILERDKSRIVVVATMRSDAFDRLQQHPALRGFSAFEVIHLNLMPVERFPELVEKPALRSHLKVEQRDEIRLIDRIVTDAKTDDALPLLAFTLQELYRLASRAGDRMLKIDDYIALGSLEGVVRTTAEHELNASNASPEEKEAFFQSFIPHLIDIDDDGHYLRRTALLEELPSEAEKLVERFVDCRLLTKRSNNGQATIEVSHEALFSVWEELRNRLDRDKEKLALLRGLERAKEVWHLETRRRRKRDLLEHRGERRPK